MSSQLLFQLFRNRNQRHFVLLHEVLHSTFQVGSVTVYSLPRQQLVLRTQQTTQRLQTHLNFENFALYD